MKKVDEGHHVQAEELLSQSLYLQHFPSSLQNDPEKQHTCVCVYIYNVRTHTQIYIYICTNAYVHEHQAIPITQK